MAFLVELVACTLEVPPGDQEDLLTHQWHLAGPLMARVATQVLMELPLGPDQCIQVHLPGVPRQGLAIPLQAPMVPQEEGPDQAPLRLGEGLTPARPLDPVPATQVPPLHTHTLPPLGDPEGQAPSQDRLFLGHPSSGEARWRAQAPQAPLLSTRSNPTEQ